MSEIKEKNQTQTTSPSAGSTDSKLWTSGFVGICIVNLLLFMNHFMMLSPFPFFIEEIGGNEAVAGLCTALFCIAAVVSRPFIGWLTDKKGRKVVALIGLIGMALMPFGYGAFPIIAVVIIFRILHGVFMSAASTGASTIASDIVPPDRFNEGIGMFSLGNALATAIAPALGLYLLMECSSKTNFVVGGTLAAVGAVLIFVRKYPKVSMPEKKMDFTKLIHKASLPASLTIMFFLMAFSSLENFLAKFAEEAGLPGGGIFFVIMAAALLVTRLFTGKAADKIGEGIFVYTCNLALAAALLLLAVIPNDLTFYIAAALTGYGLGGISPSLQAMSVHLAKPEDRGAANSTFLCAYDIGIGAGAAISGWLITLTGYHTMFAISTLGAVLSVGVYVLWGRNHPSSFTCEIKSKRQRL